MLNVYPYQLYEVLVPAKELAGSEEYWIKTSFDGSVSTDVVLKRKKLDYASQDFKNTDFTQRYQKYMSRDLLDHRYLTEFKLSSDRKYDDDQEQKQYEIRKVEQEEYLVFVMSVIKTSLAMDEANLFTPVEVGIVIRTNSLNSFSKFNSFPLSMILTISTLLVFFGVSYMVIPGLR
mmetsp:Transcript_2658/g.2529  ORF Transcript_2658/g.2529 Transcript_2658/m.2529 type:complete len:176 (+) Transcript_2658:123-650(+)